MIVVGGEALVDLLPAGPADPSGCGRFASVPGGGPCNVAVALARLGSEVALLSRLSTDAFGEAIRLRLRESGEGTGLLQRGAEPTALAVAVTGPDGSASYRFCLDGAADRLVEVPAALPVGTRALALGSLALALEPSAGVYEKLLRRESARGVFTTVDPNVRPDMFDDAYRRRFETWLPHVSLLKVSADDVQWLRGSEPDSRSALRRWLRMGPSAVVLTDGGEGLTVLVRGGLRVHVPAAPCRVVDTVGAGDTVHAALLNWLDRRGALSAEALEAMPAVQWRAALRYAARAAAVTCSRAGADSPRASEIEEEPLRQR